MALVSLEGEIMTILYTDGGCSGNGQLDMSQREMFMCVTDEKGAVLTQTRAPGGSNNIAEFTALRDALLWCQTHHITGAITIKTDSTNNLSWAKLRKVGKQVNDRGAVLALQAEIARIGIPFNLVWVPREQNLAGHVLEGVYGV